MGGSLHLKPPPIWVSAKGFRESIPVAQVVFQRRNPHMKEVRSETDAAFQAGLRGPSQKIQKSSKSLLTLRRGPDYIRLTNDGGDAAGDEEVRF
jgi:hypothetical protein